MNLSLIRLKPLNASKTKIVKRKRKLKIIHHFASKHSIGICLSIWNAFKTELEIEFIAWTTLMNQPSASNHAAATEDCSPYMDETYMDATLYNALAKGKVNMLESLLENNNLRLQLTPKRNTILHIAAQFGQLDCVQWILHQCLPSSSSSSLLQQPNLKGDTPLHLAAREGHCQVVLALIAAAKAHQQEIESEIGADKAMLRTENKEKDTALHEAVRYHHSEVVK